MFYEDFVHKLFKIMNFHIWGKKGFLLQQNSQTLV